MNIVWLLIMTASIIYSFINNTFSYVTDALFTAFNKTTELALFLTLSVCFWSGIMEIAVQSKLTDIISKMFSPVLRLLFPSLSKKSQAKKYIVMNMTANLLGLGNAATPLGIMAVKELDRENSFSEYASNTMCRFVILNTASLQLIPTTIIGLRAASGSKTPENVIVPIWITSVCALICGFLSAGIIEGSGLFE